MRFRYNGAWWRVIIQRPPCRELCEGMASYRDKIVYLHPRAIVGNMLGIISHEIAHVTMPCVSETNVLEHERLVSCVARWAVRYNGGKISIGQHRRGG